MSVELSILKLFCISREIESTHNGYIDVVDNLERELKLLFALVHTYYQELETESISKDELLNYYDIKYPKAKAREMHVDLINTSFGLDVNTDEIKMSLDQMVEKHVATQLINKLLPVMEGDKYGILDTIRGDIDSYVDLLHHPPDSLVVPVPCKLSVGELIQSEILDEGNPWHLSELTRIVGGIRPKTLGLIYAYVDSGKTSFSLASAATFAKTFVGTDSNICYAGNEEAAERMRLRFIQASTNWTRTMIKEDEDGATALADANGLDRVNIFDQITSGDQIQYILNEYKPEILYVDQATDVDVTTTRKSDGVEYQKQLFKWYRRLANKHDCAIVGVSQGVGDAENKKWLKLSDIYGSRVAIQGALDYGIGIGRRTDDPTLEDLRYIHIPKNKLNDGDGGRFTVHFTRQTAHWEEV